MRQQMLFFQHARRELKALVLLLVLQFICVAGVFADISPDLKLTVTTNPADPGDGTRFNAGVQVTLSAQATKGDTPPFAATFKMGSGANVTAIGTTNTSTNPIKADFMTFGSTLGAGLKNFSVDVVETAVPNAVSKPAIGDKSVNIDLTLPGVTVTVDNGPIFSPSGLNVVNFTITSDKDVAGIPDISISPVISGASPAPDGVPSTKTFKYKLALPNTVSAGAYTIRAVCKDTTLPNNTANVGAAQAGFSVQTSGPQAPTITAMVPPSPTHATNFKLSGGVPTGMTTIGIYENGAQVVAGNINGQTWTAGLANITEGEHKYTVKGKDVLGNDSGVSAEFVVRIDTTAPSTPVLVQPPSPTNQAKVTITGSNAMDVIGAGIISPPVTVMLRRLDGNQAATATAGLDGKFSFVDVALASGDNIFYALAEDNAKGTPGNQSGGSNNILITYNTTQSNVTTALIAGASFASQPIPLPASTMLCTGNYSLQITWNKDMDNSVNPMVGYTPAHGAEQTSNSGHWISSSTYIGQISIPAGQGNIYDGPVQSIRVTGAKDTAGNVMADYNPPGSPFTIDTTPPTTTFDSMNDIYVSSITTVIQVKGSSSDAGSGVGYVQLAWQAFGSAAIASMNVPIFNGPTASWTANWDTSSLQPGKYKLWAIAADRAQPSPNIEILNPAVFRTVIVAKLAPSVSRISIDDLLVDINAMQVASIPIIASPVVKLTAVMVDNGGSGIDFAKTQFTLSYDATNASISGNITNNGSDTLFFTFPQLTLNGTYTVLLKPFDKSGNTVASFSTRSFVVRTVGPNSVSFLPLFGSHVNDTNTAIATDQVWAFINDPQADYNKSTMDVTYNGLEVGNQIASGSTTALLWDLYGPASHSVNQSADGRYDIVVTPRDLFGNVGLATRSYFFYDSQGPAIMSPVPASGGWCGLPATTATLSVRFSDAPKDISVTHGAPPAGDSAWQNGPGTGVNIASSSFAASILGATLLGSIVGTDTLQIKTPLGPNYSDSDPGIATANIQIHALDSVTDRFANERLATWTVYFDYYRPNFTFVTPVSQARYCKPRLQLGGEVRDRGTDISMLRVQKAEISVDQLKWQAVTASLPAKVSSWTSAVDLSVLPEGKQQFTGHSFDMAGNVSDPSNATATVPVDASVTIIIDRTPPTAPSLILPLNGTVTSQRGNRFKWSLPLAADEFLFQVADDSGFNNVINTTPPYASAPATFTGLIGEVTPIGEASFAAPKDGTYYWRVAGLKLCQDGYLQSEWSTTWRLVVDSVKPKVLEVSPTPSSGNKITTGMVTFTVRFSETMDTTVAPVVSLTSAGGQQMLIEQLAYRDNTWSGTTVIPNDSSAVYDGNAIISISGAKDVAGNEMENDSTNQIVINTGPAFETRIFSNPAHEYEIMIVTRSSEALTAPPTCSVTQGGARTPVIMNFLKERYYAGSYRIDPTMSGKAYIDMSGTDLFGMVGHGSVEFQVAGVQTSSSLRVSTSDGLGVIDIGSGTVLKNTAIYFVPRTALESTASTSVEASMLARAGIRSSLKASGAIGNASDGPELQEVVSLEELGPASLRLSRKLRYTGTVKNFITSIPMQKIALYRQSGDNWIYCGGQLKGGKISAEVAGLGRLALMADIKPPTIANISPAEGANLEDPRPVIEGVLSDAGSGIIPESFSMSIDGKNQTGVSLAADGNFSFQPKANLPKGIHSIEVSVADRAGNTLRKSFTVTAPGPFAIDELMPYPNPARGTAVWFTYNLGQRADEIKLKIYDSAGALVTTFETFDFTNTSSGKLRWDLTNDNGKKVANGVYFYKMEASRNGQTFKTSGKLAVLR
ncbi:MAG: T9SS type A sorting domain-containing protein [Candidatus Riflebacteria bacterium]|nr:T9SS type A sorting domain-containing protein [Candidatus Riflebacteria bacterium]